MWATTVCYRVASLAVKGLKRRLLAALHCTDGRSRGCCCVPAGAASQPARPHALRLLRVPACKAARQRSSAHRHQRAGARHEKWSKTHVRTCERRQANARCCTAACCRDAVQRRLSRMRKGRHATQFEVHKQTNWQTAQQTLPAAYRPALRATHVKMSTYIVKVCQGWSKRCNRRKELGQSKVAHRQPLEGLQAPPGRPGNCGAATLLPCACCLTRCAAGSSGHGRLGCVCALCLHACSGCCGVFNGAKLEAVH